MVSVYGEGVGTAAEQHEEPRKEPGEGGGEERRGGGREEGGSEGGEGRVRLHSNPAWEVAMHAAPSPG